MQYSMSPSSFHLTAGQSIVPSPGASPHVAPWQSSYFAPSQPVGASQYGQYAPLSSFPPPGAASCITTGQSALLHQRQLVGASPFGQSTHVEPGQPVFPPSLQPTYHYPEPMGAPLQTVDHKPFSPTSHRPFVACRTPMEQKPFAARRTAPVSPQVPVPPNLGYSLLPPAVPYPRSTASSLLIQEQPYGTPVESPLTRDTRPPTPPDSFLGLYRARPSPPLSILCDQGASEQVCPPYQAGTLSYSRAVPSYVRVKSQQPQPRLTTVPTASLDSPGSQASFQSQMKGSNPGARGECLEGTCTDMKNVEVKMVQEQQGRIMNLMARRNEMETELAMQGNGKDHNLMELDEARQEIAQLKVEIEEMRREMDQLRDEAKTMKDRESALLEQKNVMMAELHGAKVELTGVFQEREENIMILTKLTEALKEEQGSRELAEQRNKELQGQLQKTKEATEKEPDQSFLESEVADIREECQRLTKERSDMKIVNELNLQEVRKEIMAMHNEVDRLRGRKSEFLELEVAYLRQECQRLTKEGDAVKRENERSLEVVKDEMDALRNDLDSLKGRSSEFHPQVPEKEHEGNGSGSDCQGYIRSELQ